MFRVDHPMILEPVNEAQLGRRIKLESVQYNKVRARAYSSGCAVHTSLRAAPRPSG